MNINSTYNSYLFTPVVQPVIRPAQNTTTAAAGYSELGNQTLIFSLELLNKSPEIMPAQFSAGFHDVKETQQPILPAIAKLATLYFEAVNKFFNLIQKNCEDTWKNQEVLEASDLLMKLAFTVSNLTLDDIEAVAAEFKSQGEERTFVEVLTTQDSYLYKTYFYCTEAYHHMRGALSWTTPPYNPIGEKGLYSVQVISEDHAKPFYQEGALQNSWNCLYNEFCDRMRLYLDEKILENADGRYINWTKKDIDSKSFITTPDSLPS